MIKIIICNCGKKEKALLARLNELEHKAQILAQQLSNLAKESK